MLPLVSPAVPWAPALRLNHWGALCSIWGNSDSGSTTWPLQETTWLYSSSSVIRLWGPPTLLALMESGWMSILMFLALFFSSVVSHLLSLSSFCPFFYLHFTPFLNKTSKEENGLVLHCSETQDTLNESCSSCRPEHYITQTMKL